MKKPLSQVFNCSINQPYLILLIISQYFEYSQMSLMKNNWRKIKNKKVNK